MKGFLFLAAGIHLARCNKKDDSSHREYFYQAKSIWREEVFSRWKQTMDKIYSGELSQNKSVDLIIDLLTDEGISLRKHENKLLGFRFYTYDLSLWKKNKDKPLGLALIYMKPNQQETRDNFVIHCNENIESFYPEEEMIKRYPWMKGTHKDKVWS